MSENPEDWRSAVDAGSGRTYWYHRKTRVSTWIMPDFAPTSLSSAAHGDTPSQVDDQPVEQAAKAEKLIKYEPAELSKAKVAEKSFKVVLLRVTEEPKSASSEDLKYLLETVSSDDANGEEDSEFIISALVNIVAECASVTNAYSKGTVHTALRCLFALATSQQRIYAGRCFHAHQAWTSLVDFAEQWRARPSSPGSRDDPEAALLLSALFCQLLVGPTYYMIGHEAKASLIDILDTLFIQSTEVALNFEVLAGSEAAANSNDSGAGCDDVTAVLTDRSVQTFALLAEKGHQLPAVWLLSVFTQSLRSEKLFVQVVQLGFLDALRSICISQKLGKELKVTARECLLSAMASSAFVRDRVLDSLLDLTADLGPVPVPMGPEPVLYARIPPAAAGEDDEDSQLLRRDGVGEEVDEDGEGGEGAPKTVAQARYRQMMATGYCDVPPESDESEDPDDNAWNAFSRDVEWIPKSGTPWRLSSSVLWARCPALRELINGFWDEGGGGLELSIDACDEVLAALCRYMHTGLLALPIGVHRQLELLRVGSELGMHSLYRAAAEALQQKLTLQSAHVVVAFCAEQGFADLERTARIFISSGGKRATVIRYQNANELNPQNAYLRDAIFASLQDVNTVLAQKPTAASITPGGGGGPGAKAASQVIHMRLEPSPAVQQPAPNNRAASSTAITASAYSAYSARADTALEAPLQMEKAYGLDDHRDREPLDPYYSSAYEDPSEMYGETSLSLLDIAGGNSHSANAGASFQEDYLDRNVMNAVRNTHAGNPASNLSPQASSSNKAGKPRGGSGGIYGLLLQGSADPALQEYLHPPGTGKSRPGQPAHPPASKVPGRVMGDKRLGSSSASSQQPRAGNANQSGSAKGSLAAGQKPTAPVQKAAAGSKAPSSNRDAVEATPRTQRASSLLASARPSAYASDDFDYYSSSGGGTDNHFYGEEDGDEQSDFDRYAFEGDNSFFALQDHGRGGPQEFVGQMSLAPSKEPSENEKRIERLTRPTKVLGTATKALKLEPETGVTEEPENDSQVFNDDDEGREAALVRPAQSSSPLPQATSRPRPVQADTASVSGRAGIVSAPAQQRPPTGGSGGSGLVALKRSVSPSTTSQSSREGHLLSIGSATPVDCGSSQGMTSPAGRANSGDINVRGSLTLLKTKGINRRRRSVADIEGTQQASQLRDEDEAVTTSTTSLEAPQPTQTHKPSIGRNLLSAPVRNPAHVALDLSSYLQPDEPQKEERRHSQRQEQDRRSEHEDQGARYEEDEEGNGGHMLQCPTCSRRFNPAPFEKHVKICEKVFVEKRKAFDSSKMRIEGNPDLKEFIQETKGPVGRSKKGKPAAGPPQERKQSSAANVSSDLASKKWKNDSNAFRAAMKNARDVTAAIAKGEPLPPPLPSAPDNSLVPCPHCSRKFSAGAAERHIPLCTSIRAKPAPLKRGGGGNASKGATTPSAAAAARSNKAGAW